MPDPAASAATRLSASSEKTVGAPRGREVLLLDVTAPRPHDDAVYRAIAGVVVLSAST
jgi:hypothetical protein